MNKQVIHISAAALLATAVGFASIANAASQGQVTFNGELTNDTCAIKAGDDNKVITLGKIPTNALTASGRTAGSQMFTIGVDNCPTGTTTVTAHWETTNMNPDTGNARNQATGTGAATNVDVQLLDRDGTTPLRLGSRGVAVAVSGTGTTRGATLNYGGQYYATGATTAGTVTAVARFTLAYN
ncbi:fimbrial protein [Cupriavidus campinensis]